MFNIVRITHLMLIIVMTNREMMNRQEKSVQGEVKKKYIQSLMIGEKMKMKY